MKTKIWFYFWRVRNAIRIGWWVYKNPKTLAPGNFKILSDLFELIMKVATEDRHRMTHVAYIHPDEGEKQIVSIWAGAGMESDPTKRIAELLSENANLKDELVLRITGADKNKQKNT